jgi:small subunit ribosomal protein S2e
VVRPCRVRRCAARAQPERRVPVTKLGRLVKDGKIKSMEEIYLFSLPVKEYQIVDFFLPKLKDEVMKIMPVQKQTRAGQRTRFKAFVAIGDSDGHVGLGVKCAKEVATAIRGAIILAKLSVVPVRRGYWGAKLGEPHTVPAKVSGKVGSVMCRLIPAPRGTGIVAAPASKRLIELAGIGDVYTQSRGSTATMGNFLKATFVAVRAVPCVARPHADARVDLAHVLLHHPRLLARHPRAEGPVRRVQRAPAAHRQEGGVLGVFSLCTSVCRAVFSLPLDACFASALSIT